MGVFWAPESLLAQGVCKDCICKGNTANITCTVLWDTEIWCPDPASKDLLPSCWECCQPHRTGSASESPVTQEHVLPWAAHIYWLTNGCGINVLAISAHRQLCQATLAPELLRSAKSVVGPSSQHDVSFCLILPLPHPSLPTPPFPPHPSLPSLLLPFPSPDFDPKDIP